jgi:hypothetical protein
MIARAFLSYSRLNAQFARKIAQLLREMGVIIWIDEANIRPGSTWADEIQQALDECNVMLLVLTPEAMDSSQVKREWLYWLGTGKRLIPLLLKPTKVHYQLYDLQYVDFVRKSFIAAFAELCMGLKSWGFRVGDSNRQRPRLDASTIGLEVPLLGREPGYDADEETYAPQPLLPPQPSLLSSPPRVLVPPPLRRVEELLSELFEWIEIADGELTLVDGRLNQDGGFPLPAYHIARYPITNAQYQLFLDAADGYRQDVWWTFSDSALLWRKANPQPRPAHAPDNHPRVGVTWFEAVAFCRWLTYRVGAQHPDVQISLPTVQQWHWAAVADSGYAYPWGSRFKPRYCNTAESNLCRTTPVTQYPWGASAYGLMDLCGNSSDWCLNDWVSGTTDIRHESGLRFTLGGSWRDTHDYGSVHYQGYAQPDACRRTQGFRIAATVIEQ